MTKPQQHFTGTIGHRQRKKVYDKDSAYYQQIYYRLTITNSHQQTTLFVYSNLVPTNIWTTIDQALYQEKKYLFTAKRTKWGWILLNWTEMNN